MREIGESPRTPAMQTKLHGAGMESPEASSPVTIMQEAALKKTPKYPLKGIKREERIEQ